MRIVFVSNFLNHHQLPLCEKFYELSNGNFSFVANACVPRERLELGYQNMNDEYSFVIKTYESQVDLKKSEEIILNADIVIAGIVEDDFVNKRIREGKLTYFYMERLFKYGFFHYNKKGFLKIPWPNFYTSGKKGFLYDYFIRYRNYDNLYLLCASNYVAGDFGLIRCFKNKALKWGYFPRIFDYDIDKLQSIKDKDGVVKLLWVGRLVDWKHPDDVIWLANKLKVNGYHFHLDIVGTGEEETYLQKEIQSFGLSEVVTMHGSMGFEQVRNVMEKADIFLFTSDYKEGWGAVLNEAMNSGCAIVANRAAGSTDFLIQNGKNGFSYNNGNRNLLYKKVSNLIENKEIRKKFGKNAYFTMMQNWNANVAAQRLVEFSASVKTKTKMQYETGPCSKAKRVIKGFLFNKP